jgi:dephospho-CoA kinase
LKAWGLTGGIGMGKSAAEALLAERGVPVIDTDLLARQIVEPGQPALAEIQRVFGGGIIAPDGRLNREELAARVFADAVARRRLEEILHPRIRQLWHAQLETWRTEQRPLAVVIVPLLFETGAQADFDKVLCIGCSAATQRERLLARGWTPQQIQQRNAAQWSIAQKMARADYAIWNDAGLDVLAEQLDRVLRVLTAH